MYNLHQSPRYGTYPAVVYSASGLVLEVVVVVFLCLFLCRLRWALRPLPRSTDPTPCGLSLPVSAWSSLLEDPSRLFSPACSPTLWSPCSPSLLSPRCLLASLRVVTTTVSMNINTTNRNNPPMSILKISQLPNRVRPNISCRTSSANNCHYPAVNW